MCVALGVTAGIAAGASFATGGVLQQRVAARMTGQRSLSVRLLTSLARRPQWLAGIGVDAASYGLQALALSAAPLAVVQPLLAIELVVAIPVSSWLYGRPLGVREWAGLVTVAAGLAAALWGAAPHSGGGGTPLRWLVAGGSLAMIAALLAAAGWRRRGLARAGLYAAAAALVFALSSALLASAVAGFAAGGIGGLANPAVYGMAVASIAGLMLIQSAFQAGPLVVSMPLLDWVQPLVAVVLGVAVLRESLDTTPVHLAMLAAGAVAALAGIITLNTSPRVRALQRLGTAAAVPHHAA